MPKVLVIVDGPSGAGKTALQNHVKTTYPGVEVIHKRTDRPAEKQAAGRFEADQIPIGSKEFDRLIGNSGFLWYEFGRYRYGFDCDELTSRRFARVVWVIVRDINLIARLKGLCPLLGVQALSLYIDTPQNLRRTNIVNQATDDPSRTARPVRPLGQDELKKIDDRLKRDNLTYPPGRASTLLYDRVFHNRGSLDDLFGDIIGFLNDRMEAWSMGAMSS